MTTEGERKREEKGRRIKLTQGKYAIVDAADFDWLNQWKWCATRDGGTFYAVRGGRKKENEGNRVRMHRLITDAPRGLEVDHINHDGLDNRRENLRIASKAQNCWNSKAKNPVSGYKGVHWHKQSGKWVVKIGRNGVLYSMGSFTDKEEAAKAYNKKAKELFGKFAYLNKIK